MNRELPVRKNQEIELHIDALTAEGAGVGRMDGYVILVPGALPEEQVKVHIMRTTSGYAVGKLLEVLVPSSHRVTPHCPCYAACGGCSLQHLSYENQLEEKRRTVEDAFRRIGGFTDVEVQPVLGMENPWAYRNKGAFPYGADAKGDLAFGFYAPRSHRLTPAEECAIERPEIMNCIRAMGDWARKFSIQPYNELNGTGVLRHGVVRVTGEGKTMVVVVTTGALPHKRELLEALSMADSVYHNVNNKNTNVIFGEKMTLLKGEPVLTESICGLKYQVDPRSFLQVNPIQTKVLYETALRLLNPLPHETIADLYCGMGSISLLLAQHCKQVIGIENVPAAVEDAGKNAKRNGITNADFICAPAEEALPKLMKEGLRLDAISLDPPRKGCDARVLEAILASSVQRLVYVSCDPATLARDVKILAQGGFTPRFIQPVDMFPQTGHVETVCLLSKLQNRQHIEIELHMDELDVTDAEKKATYPEIKEYVMEHYGYKIPSLYIAQVKQKCGIIERENYNKSKYEHPRQAKCPPEKEAAIMEALQHFGMV